MRKPPLFLLAALLVSAVAPASAEGYRGVHTIGPGYRHAAGIYPRVAYGGFARPFVEGDYIGAPFTSVPSPSHLVPTPWSYGTYGVPTVSGIPPSPVGQPTLTVIHAPGGRKGVRSAVSGGDDDPGDLRVVGVRVPRR